MITSYDVFGSVVENFFRLLLDLADKVNDAPNPNGNGNNHDPDAHYKHYAPKPNPDEGRHKRKKPGEKRNELDPYNYMMSVPAKKQRHLHTVKKDEPNRLEEYATIESHLKNSRKGIPGAAKSPSNLYRTAGNIVNNIVDNTIGFPIAKWQNYKTTRALKKGKDKPVVYLMHGIMQNVGSQWKLGKELKKKGYHVYHLKGNHGKRDINHSVEKAYEQIEKFQKKTGIYETASNRRDYFSGHSSGADTGIHMAADRRTIDAGIRRVQARAPVPYGMKLKTYAQRAVGVVGRVKNDNLRHDAAKRRAMDTYRKTPHVPVHVMAGKYDKLIPPDVANYVKQKSYQLITHKDSGHFGTSGGNKDMNKMFVNEIDKYKKMDYSPGEMMYRKAA